MPSLELGSKSSKGKVIRDSSSLNKGGECWRLIQHEDSLQVN